MRALFFVAAMLFAIPAMAVEPGEVLDDPALEARARELSKGLRCLVCQNESIDESNADLARELRVLVRERLVAGDSDDEVMRFLVERYGEFVLLRPNSDGVNWLLWAAGPLMLVFAGISGAVYLRGRSKAVPAHSSGLSDEEERRLQALLDE